MSARVLFLSLALLAVTSCKAPAADAVADTQPGAAVDLSVDASPAVDAPAGVDTAPEATAAVDTAAEVSSAADVTTALD